MTWITPQQIRDQERRRQQSQQTSTGRPPGSAYTQAVRDQGLAATRATQQAAAMGYNDRDEAYRQMLDQNSLYEPPQPNAISEAYRQARGFGALDYPVVVGQNMGGDYNGFKTEGQLKNAVLGFSEATREQDRAMAQQYGDQANTYLDQVQQAYDQMLQQAQVSPSMSGGAGMANAVGREVPFQVDENGQKIAVEGYGRGTTPEQVVTDPAYQDYLNQWSEKASTPYKEALNAAAVIGQTPLRDYATMAGQQYGVDPYIVRGWYDEASQLQDVQDQTDLESYYETGLTPDEIARVNAEDAKSQDQYDEATQLAIEEAISGATGMDANALAQKSNLPMDTLYSVAATPEFQQWNDAIEQIIADAAATADEGGVGLDVQSMQDQIGRVLDDSMVIPEVYQVLYSKWYDQGYGNPSA